MGKPDFAMIKTLDPTAIFSINETARMLGLSHSGVLSKIKRGTLKFAKSGSRYFILGSEIQKEIQQELDI